MLERDMRLSTDRWALPTRFSDLHRIAEILQRARDAGLGLSASVSIHHVTLNEKRRSARTVTFLRYRLR